MDISRPIAPDPYELLPQFPAFTLQSETLTDGDIMPDLCTGAGGDISPQLSWSGFPEETRSFVLTCFDPDAPSPAGFWHWCVIDLPTSVTSLDLDAGASDTALPAGFHVRNDDNKPAYIGAAPPVGDHPHRYIFTVYALDVETLDINPADSTPTRAALRALFNCIAQARLTVTYQR
ncbi:MAG: YbhB/YbcL family Raf kinase inhibitor-like protein [Actinomycetaceae bacterium]|nr:YbhB/YbcL family Raf kinase inhibitor-like protein [Actinomycetaceae bacterium]